MTDIESTYELSPTQQGMLFDSLFAPNSGVHIEQMSCRFREALDVRAFKAAWEAVARRHASLRAGFRWEKRDQPAQVIHRDCALNFAEEDWSALTESQQSARLQKFLAEDRTSGFQLDRPPLFRVALFRCGESDYRCVWTFHHILLDGRSFPLIVKEVFSAYESLRNGVTLRFESAPDYSEYIQWLKESEAGRMNTAGPFWRELLAGFSAATPVGGNSIKGAAPQAQFDFRLPLETTRALSQFASANNITLSTIVYGAWSILLSRYSGEEDVVFGGVRACRRSSIPNAEQIAGVFMNTLPVRVSVAPQQTLAQFLRAIREQQFAVRDFEHTPLTEIQKWSDVPRGAPLFESLVIFESYAINSLLRGQGGPWLNREFQFHEQTNFPLTLFVYSEPEMLLKIAYEQRRFSVDEVARMAGHLQNVLNGIAVNPNRALRELPITTNVERHQFTHGWNQTSVGYSHEACIHELIEAQAHQTPDAIAAVFGERQLTYRELNARASQLAQRLKSSSVGPDTIVGIFMDRSLEMLTAMLAVLKSGGAYLPLDPAYPAERLQFMLEDSGARVVLTQSALREQCPNADAELLCVDTEIVSTREFASSGVRSNNLAYVIYTSGSTGKPKGVMITHRNVVNFFAGMDERLGTQPGTWLALTSISFDISVLELLWTLARGFKIVIHKDELKPSTPVLAQPMGKMDFSLFYFASSESSHTRDKYKLLLEGAKFADENGFSAVWTPERHFHAFGGLYPNPSVTSAAVAAVTRNIQIRAGSVVLPLHNPIRVAEEWSVVDNISNGRVGLSFASGWHDRDFVFAPENYRERKDVMFRGIETVRALWRGEKVSAKSGAGADVQVGIMPRPVQKDVPIWVTAATSAETCRAAGKIGANLLTNLLGQSIEELAEKIAAYREARREAGHSGDGLVSVMLHTFIGENIEEVREIVRKPFSDYLRTSVDLLTKSPWAKEAFFKKSGNKNSNGGLGSSEFSAEDMDALVAYSFEKYFESSGLFGTPESCLRMIDRLRAGGVDEIACLIDFGVNDESVLKSLEHLNRLRQLSNSSGDAGITAQVRRHGVTHMQCTPSRMRMIVSDPTEFEAVRGLSKLLLGGEPLQPDLFVELRKSIAAEIHNMYGPTETTVWSSSAKLDGGTITVGRPIANTQIYILDSNMQPAPVGIGGEVFIGGDGVARGYLNRPELTAERFIENPFRSGERIYRTGDRGKFLPDGRIELLGRNDHQIKIRGHRVELGEIEAALLSDTDVREAAVIARPNGAADDLRLHAYVVANAPTSGHAGTIERWQSVWNESYAGSASGENNFDTRGWISSYTGKPLPKNEMREWLDATVERIFALKPKRVLEIGCGTGMVLLRVAPSCEHYTGIDISNEALERLRAEVSRQKIQSVELIPSRADEIDKLTGRFDTIILNSVIQYFPGAEYLQDVLAKCAALLEPEGRIFVGDVRNHAWLEAFHASVLISQLSPDESARDLQRRVQKACENERELLVDPRFFEKLRSKFARASSVETLLRRGTHQNEMTKFRYDAVLHFGVVSQLSQKVERIDWRSEPDCALRIQTLLTQPKTAALHVANIPNARLQKEIVALKRLGDPGRETIADMRVEMEFAPSGIEPDAIAALAAGSDFDIQIVPGTASEPVFDAFFFRRGVLARHFGAQTAEPGALLSFEWRELTSRPKTDVQHSDLASTLREILRQKLPEHMVPQTITLLERLPLTPNGKLDRRALPEPEQIGQATVEASAAPGSPIEESIAAIWKELLGISRVGVHDSFFELGGHSLLATQLISRMREKFSVKIPLRKIFEKPTVAHLAKALAEAEGTQQPVVARERVAMLV